MRAWDIPWAPQRRRIQFEAEWNGAPLADPALAGSVELQATDAGLVIVGSLPDPSPAPGPSEPPGTAVERLWETDVVEVFLAGETRYVEVELGAWGHYLILAFDAPRIRSRHPCPDPGAMSHSRDATGWRTSLTLPWSAVPDPTVRMNAFAIARRTFVAAAALPGDRPDFHQPSFFPRVTLTRWPSSSCE